MNVLKNHFSLILALFTILFTVQIFFIVDRVIDAYEEKLSSNYSIIVLSNSKIKKSSVTSLSSLIKSSEELSPQSVIDDLKSDLKHVNFELLKATLPHFYKISLTHFPTPDELKTLKSKLLHHHSITKVESFSQSHDKIYKLLILFKKVTDILALAVLGVTSLLIIKELKIWQFQHVERMSIMALFGAPVWLRSAVLFRLAIFDAIISSILIVGVFSMIKTQAIVDKELTNIGIQVEVFDLVKDGTTLSLLALFLSILLASMIVLAHKEEV